MSEKPNKEHPCPCCCGVNCGTGEEFARIERDNIAAYAELAQLRERVAKAEWAIRCAREFMAEDLPSAAEAVLGDRCEGLHVVDAKQWAVLEAMKGFKTEWMHEHVNQAIETKQGLNRRVAAFVKVFEAELARREAGGGGVSA